jgi:hypothetical protein
MGGEDTALGIQGEEILTAENFELKKRDEAVKFSQLKKRS